MGETPVQIEPDLDYIHKRNADQPPPPFLRALAARIQGLFGGQQAANVVDVQEAAAHFLQAMEAVAARTYPQWSAILNARLSDCPLSFEDQRAIIDRHPLDDYYFAGIVALEMARMRRLYPPTEADEILGEIGEQMDRVVGRMDRIVSDLAFDILGRIELGTGVDRMKMPHDKVVKAILEHMGFKKNDHTRALLSDIELRHTLGEPLAVHVPQWWKAFQEHFSLRWTETKPEKSETTNDSPTPASSEKITQPKRWRRRRAASLMDE